MTKGQGLFQFFNLSRGSRLDRASAIGTGGRCGVERCAERIVVAQRLEVRIVAGQAADSRVGGRWHVRDGRPPLRVRRAAHGRPRACRSHGRCRDPRREPDADADRLIVLAAIDGEGPPRRGARRSFAGAVSRWAAWRWQMLR